MTKRIPNWLVKRAFLTPERPAIVFNKTTITFKELYAQTHEMGKKLTSIGIQKGDRVSVLMGNHLDMVILLHALQLIGCETVLLNIRLHPKELQYQIEDSAAKFLITAEQFIDKVNY